MTITRTMKALTLWQPWASLIACGAKTFETRSYRPPATLQPGDRFAIHAAKKPARAALEYLGVPDIAVTRMHHALGCEFAELPLGAVICTVKLDYFARCYTASGGRVRLVQPDHRDEFIEPDPYGDYSQGRWAWRLKDVRVLDRPQPARGSQGIWEWEGSA